MMGKYRRLYICVLVSQLQCWADTNVTQAFVEETDDTDDTDNIDDTDDTFRKISATF